MNSSRPREHFAGVVVTDDGVDTGESAFNQRRELQSHLAMEIFKALVAAPDREVVVDHHPERQVLTAGRLLAIAAALGRRWRSTIVAPRVGIVLPPGIGAFVANVGALFAGKVPVNLNFTLGRATASACLRKAGLDTVLSAPALREKLAEFPWPERTLAVRDEIDACGPAEIGRWLTAIKTRPGDDVALELQLPERGGDAEAAILFTSGSAGDPKGVVLTHRNILGNCRQVREVRLIRPGDTMIGCLPVFHSFGFTVTLCYPLLHDVRMATFPSPLETKRLAEIIAAERADVLIGAPTFLRPFLKRAEPAQLRSLRLVVAGAEKMPRDLHEGFMERFNLPVREGYGLTETSPALALNRPDPVPLATGGTDAGHRLGTVGLLMPGMRARIVDPATHATLPRGEVGVLAVRGCNIFGGYLEDPTATEAVLRDGWFITGDLARFDDIGFLTIEGRLSRFSKIGGEMVPHIKVEQSIIDAFGWQGAELQPVVVVGMADDNKGEALVVLTSHAVTVAAIREKLSAAGLPNLWIPKRVVHVEKVPLLPTGKLDLRGCKSAAECGSSNDGHTRIGTEGNEGTGSRNCT